MEEWAAKKIRNWLRWESRTSQRQGNKKFKVEQQSNTIWVEKMVQNPEQGGCPTLNY